MPLGAGKAAEAQPLQSASQRDRQWVAESGGSVSLEGTWGALVLAALARWELLGPAWEALGLSGLAASVLCLETPALLGEGA